MSLAAEATGPKGFDLRFRQVRLLSGLVLFAFVASHLLNLALGLVSFEALDRWRPILIAPFANPVGEVLLVLSVLVHVAAGLATTARRRSFALTRLDLLQLALGLATPPLVMAHVLTMRMTGAIVAGFEASYATILAIYWSAAPLLAIQQLLAVAAVWLHAVIGFYAVLVLRPVWPRIRNLVLPLLFGLPVMALLGFARGGTEVVAQLAADPAARARLQAATSAVATAAPTIFAWQDRLLFAYAVAVLLALAAWFGRATLRRRSEVRVRYDGGIEATGRAGLSVLEISRLAGVDHAHVCEGRGRCGTCRIAVHAGGDRLSAPGAAETRTLRSLGAIPNVRLACQARVLSGAVVVERLVPAYADASAARHPEDWIEDRPEVTGVPAGAAA
ncbi:2Fe-2S iron-sulfur cluster-binding protein [Aureimonas leprariae]|uniref:(2Fe-2S)-binding protein n=1 Tax=Plantimonas leprariae TaxID=2615207 RepID=A0A7V7TZ86_9HYPH|nr:2Fe-2S iron-sulfur cluster-binding protein [Aureimonas leprariae]KAB0679019.1 (2Fe-2S)-binding protein [Aureimonas leprariae]